MSGAPTLTVVESVPVNVCGLVGVQEMPELSVTAASNAENWLNSVSSFCRPIVAQAPPVQSSGSPEALVKPVYATSRYSNWIVPSSLRISSNVAPSVLAVPL